MGRRTLQEWETHFFDCDAFISCSMEEQKRMLYDLLPSRSSAFALCTTYFDHLAWLFGGIARDELFALLDYLYPNRTKRARYGTLHLHQLALVYMVLSIAAQVDPEQEPHEEPSRAYFILGTIALGIDNVLEHPSTYAACALVSLLRLAALTRAERTCTAPNGMEAPTQR